MSDASFIKIQFSGDVYYVDSNIPSDLLNTSQLFQGHFIYDSNTFGQLWTINDITSKYYDSAIHEFGLVIGSNVYTNTLDARITIYNDSPYTGDSFQADFYDISGPILENETSSFSLEKVFFDLYDYPEASIFSDYSLPTTIPPLSETEISRFRLYYNGGGNQNNYVVLTINEMDSIPIPEPSTLFLILSEFIGILCIQKKCTTRPAHLSG